MRDYASQQALNNRLIIQKNGEERSNLRENVKRVEKTDLYINILCGMKQK